LYANETSEALVLNGGDGNSSSVNPHLWVYGGNHGSVDALTNFQYLVGANYALFSREMKAVGIYKCPADRSTWKIAGKDLMELRGYALNIYLGTPPANVMTPLETNSSYRVAMKMSQISRPSDRFVFIDVNPASICTPAFGVDIMMQKFIHMPSSFHRERGVVSFADGHVEGHKWVDGRTRMGVPPGSQYIPHGIGSPGNQDLVWIAQRAATKNF